MNQPLSNLTQISYQQLLKPLLFQFDAEKVHHFFVGTGKLMGSNRVSKSLTKWLWAHNTKSTQQVVDTLLFPNPIGLSAGFDYNADLTTILPSVGYGFHTVGTITWEPYDGNPQPRLSRFPRSKALLVNKGLKNIGTRAIAEKLKNQRFDIPTGISIASTNKHFTHLTEQLADILLSFSYLENQRDLHHHYYEMNISCPNTFGGEPFTTPERLQLLLTCLDALHLSRPLYLKMPIDQTKYQTLQLLEVIDKHQVNGVIFGNLTKDKTNPTVDETDRRLWRTRKGNLSGKPTWERSNALIELTKKTYGDRFTIIGTGGVFTGEDAAHKLALGADLVQMITGMVYGGPQTIGQINYYLDQN